MASPEIVVLPLEDTEKTPTRPPPLTAREANPGPVMVSLLLIAIGPEVRTIGEHEATEGAKVIVLLAGDAATSARSEPGPESPQLVTEKVSALAVPAGSTATEVAARPTSRLVAPIRRTAREMQCRDLMLELIAMLLCVTGSPEDRQEIPRPHPEQGQLQLRSPPLSARRALL
jgi:hypothetical protein